MTRAHYADRGVDGLVPTDRHSTATAAAEFANSVMTDFIEQLESCFG
jgi:hypothetical protein